MQHGSVASTDNYRRGSVIPVALTGRRALGRATREERQLDAHACFILVHLLHTPVAALDVAAHESRILFPPSRL